jgi:hypothetical protein
MGLLSASTFPPCFTQDDAQTRWFTHNEMPGAELMALANWSCPATLVMALSFR